MANIQTYLNKIKNAIYGRDVRDSIHDAIDAINTESENTKDIIEDFVGGELDTTLTSTTLPSQGKAVGDAVADLKSQLNPVLHSILTKGLIVPYKYKMENGKTYRFKNMSTDTAATYKCSCYVSVDGTANTTLVLDNLNPGATQFFTADRDYEYIRVYRGSANESIQLYVCEGEFVDALRATNELGGQYYNTLGEAIRRQIEGVLSNMPDQTIEVGTGKAYTSILAALKYTSDNVVIHVNKGTYDIEQEYIDYYGSDYWNNYNGYLNSDDKFSRGLWLGNGRKITFDANANVVFQYAGTNTSVKGNFSPFATSGNCEINGLNLTFSGCRYAIHDDFFEVDGTEIFKNCIFNGQSNNGDTIGAGLGRSNLIIIENCLFIGNQSTAGGDISYHNNGHTSNSKSKIIVKGCYGENTVKFKWYGTNTEVSECIACGNQFKSIECMAHSVAPNETVNMRLTKWNNVETGS